MNPSDDFVMEEKALKLLASLHELTSLNIDSQSQTTCNFCIRKVHSVINDTIPFEVACAPQGAQQKRDSRLRRLSLIKSSPAGRKGRRHGCQPDTSCPRTQCGWASTCRPPSRQRFLHSAGRRSSPPDQSECRNGRCARQKSMHPVS